MIGGKWIGRNNEARIGVARVATALAFMSVGALAVGALAVGRLAVGFAGGHPIAATRGQAERQETLAGVSDLLHFTPMEIQTLKTGRLVSKLLDSDPDYEVAVAGAVWISAPVSKYIQAIKNIEHLERGKGFQVTRLISDPPRLKDFAALQLPDVDIKDLKACRVGECAVNMDENMIERIQKEIDWSKPSAASDVNALVRQLALEYVTGYQQGGNKELAVYRDKSRPTYV